MKRRILVIDDSPMVHEKIKDTLKNEEYELIGFCKTGEEGIEKYRELLPDVVTIDIIMPGIDGIETATTIKKEFPNSKIVMLSSLCDIDTFAEVKDLGINFFVPKPIEDEMLIKALNNVFAEDEQ